MSNYLSELTLPNGEEYLLKDAEARRELLTKANSIDNEDYTEEYVKTFYSDATGCRIGYEIQLEPKQDLHGYEYPWQGGAGKNLLAGTLANIKAKNTSGTWTDNVYVYNSVTMTVYTNAEGSITELKFTGTSSTSSVTSFGIYEFDFVSSTEYKLNGLNGGSDSTFRYNIQGVSNYTDGDNTITGDGSTHNVRVQVLGNASTGFSVYPMLRLATVTDATFAPYSNICPITPYTEVNITRSWRNLYNENALGSIQINEDGLMRGGFILSRPGTYTSSVVNAPGTNQYINIKRKKDGTFTNLYTYGSSDTDDFTFTINKGEVVTISVNSSSLETSKNVLMSTQFQVEEGTHKTEYAIPYGETFTVTLPTEAGSVYSGMLSVNEDGSGRIVVDRLSTIFSDASWTRSVNNELVSYKYVAAGKKSGYGTVISSAYRTGTQTDSGEGTITGRISTTNVFIVDSRYDSTADWLDVVGNETLVYELENPVSYNLTAPQVTSLLGYNSIRNDAGPFMKLTYEGQIKQELDKKVDINNIVTDSTAASVKTLYDCADGMPMSVIAEITPVQDLHGYSNPYPAGASKNKLPMPVADEHDGIKLVHNNDGSFTLTGTATATTYFDFFDGTFDSTTYAGYKFIVYATSGTVGSDALRFRISTSSSRTSLQEFTSAETEGTIADNGTGLSFAVRIPNGYAMPTDGCVVKAMMYASTETSEFVPYANICPISGWDSVQITRTGKNIWDEEYEDGRYNNDTGAKSTGTGKRSKNAIRIIPSTNYYFQVNNVTSRVLWYKENGDFIYSEQINSTNGFIAESPANAKFVKFFIPGSDVDISNVCVNVSDSNFNGRYEPFGKTYPISIPTTAYGGTLTINKDGSGKLVIDSKLFTIPTIADFSGSGGSGNWKYKSGIVLDPPQDRTSNTVNIISETLKGIAADDERQKWSVFTGKTSNSMSIYCDTDTTVEEFNANIAGCNVLYKLATPVTYNFTAQQIRSLFAENNLWADCGDILSVQYYRNINSGYAVAIKSDNKVYTNENGIIDFDEFGAKKNYGSENAGKFLVVGSTGDVEAVSMNAWQGGSY